MKLEEMSTSELLALHNSIADKAAGTKTFSTRGKLVTRIESIATAKNIDLTSSEQPEKAKKGVAQPHRPDAEATVDGAQNKEATAGRRGKGVGVLARELLMNPEGYPYSTIAEKINERISGARATVSSVRWYANDMRRSNVLLPARQRAGGLSEAQVEKAAGQSRRR